jgi:hypothetical protein
MTSSRRCGPPGSYEGYKKFDPLCEPGLVSILFLSCGKHKLARHSLESTFAATRQYDGEIEWCFLEQGQNDDAAKNLQMFEALDVERKVILRPNGNYGINSGFNSLWAVSRGEFCMNHEDDWMNREPDFDFLTATLEIFREFPDIGIVQVRAAFDPNENWGFRKPDYNPWTCDFIEAGVVPQKTASGHEFLACDYDNGWNHNPQIVRKSVFRACGPLDEPPLDGDMRYGEDTMQAAVAKNGCTIAH